MNHLPLSFSRLLQRLLCLAATLLLLQAPALAGIYKTVDENGKVVYTDRPDPNDASKAVELPVLNTQPSTPVAAPKRAPREVRAPQKYLISVSSPGDNSQIPMGQKLVPVNISLQPALFKEHRVQLYLNGSRFGPARQSSQFTLDNLYRGEHKLRAAVVTKKGKIISRSASVTVAVQRRSVLN